MNLLFMHQVLGLAQQGQAAFDKEDSRPEDNVSDDSPPASNTTVAAKVVAHTSDSPKKMKISGVSRALVLFALLWSTCRFLSIFARGAFSTW